MKLSIKNLNVTINNIKLINGFAFDFFDNNVYIVKGENGSGKTTLLKAIIGLINSNGTILIDDKEINEITKYMSYQFQNPNDQFITSTVMDELILAAEIVGIESKLIDKKIKKISSMLKINKIMDNKIKTLSMGEKQRLAFAILLIQNKKIFLLDEPISMLDKKNILNFFKIINEIKKEKIIIWVSHDKDVMKKYENHILLQRNKDNEN